MFVWGRNHPLKDPCVRILDLVAQNPAGFFIDAEILQEILHRYTAVRRWQEVQRHFESFAWLLRGRIEPMRAEDVQLAASFPDTYPHLAARDLVHLAVMQRVGARYIISADAAFDGIQEIERLDPAHVDEWRALVNS